LTEQVYGVHAVTALLAREPQTVARLLIQAGQGDKRLAGLRAQAEAAGIAVEELPRRELDRRVPGRHQGVIAELAAASLPRYGEGDISDVLDAAGPTPLVLVLDQVTDPHNLGACLRTADAAGVCLVLAPRDKAASLNATARKVACGAAETVPFVAVTNLARSLRELKERGIWLVGAAGEAERSLYAQDLRGPVALVMGAEGSGLRRLTREHCDYLVHLPMAGAVSSLNVSVATGICLFEALRQRLAV
jgi:23S rRNA (guanosine2251-2'-O)-methyltransferase